MDHQPQPRREVCWKYFHGACRHGERCRYLHVSQQTHQLAHNVGSENQHGLPGPSRLPPRENASVPGLPAQPGLEPLPGTMPAPNMQTSWHPAHMPPAFPRALTPTGPASLPPGPSRLPPREKAAAPRPFARPGGQPLYGTMPAPNVQTARLPAHMLPTFPHGLRPTEPASLPPPNQQVCRRYLGGYCQNSQLCGYSHDVQTTRIPPTIASRGRPAGRAQTQRRSTVQLERPHVEAVFSPDQQLPTPFAPRMDSDEMPVLRLRARSTGPGTESVFKLDHIPDPTTKQMAGEAVPRSKDGPSSEGAEDLSARQGGVVAADRDGDVAEIGPEPGAKIDSERESDQGVQMPRDATLSLRDRLKQLKFGDGGGPQ